MVPKQVSYRFPGIDYGIASIQRGKVPIPKYVPTALYVPLWLGLDLREHTVGLMEHR